MAMVEMVFVLPLLILIVFAIAQFGLMFSRWLTLSNAVREGSRMVVTFRGQPCNAGTVTTQVKNRVVNYARAGGLPLTTGAVNVTPPPCQPQGTQVTVDATYQFPINIPFARIAPVNLYYSSSMRQE